MVKVREDLTGRTFGRWTVLRRVDDYVAPSGYKEPQWLCKCSCEEQTEKIISGYSLKNGYSKSCGCIVKEIGTERFKSFHKTNKYDISGEYGIGWTSNTNKEFYFDIEDYNLIKDYCWNEQINVKTNHSVLRAYSPDTKRHIYMHQLITEKKDMDHENLNTLDNRKCNLREATRSQQGANRPRQSNNTSGFTGVYWYKRNNTWRAEIKINKKTIHIGYFKSKYDAIVARLKAEKEHFGEFAPQRHLFEQYNINVNGGDSND